jgi:hypothetical protein
LIKRFGAQIRNLKEELELTPKIILGQILEKILFKVIEWFELAQNHIQ